MCVHVCQDGEVVGSNSDMELNKGGTKKVIFF